MTDKLTPEQKREQDSFVMSQPATKALLAQIWPVVENPRALTPDEMADKLVKHLTNTAIYWAKVETYGRDNRPITHEERCLGLIHTTLSVLDGCALTLPAFELTPVVDPSDKPHALENSNNWVEPVPIGGDLTDRFNALRKSLQS